MDHAVRGVYTVRMHGTSLSINIGKACRVLGVNEGDQVEVEIRPYPQGRT